MIYNFIEYLKTKTPAIAFASDGFNPASPEECVNVEATGGQVRHDTGRKDYSAQLIARAKSAVRARAMIEAIFSWCHNYFAVALPSATVNGTTFPSVVAYQISAIQAPAYLGTDENGRHMYVFNVTMVAE